MGGSLGVQGWILGALMARDNQGMEIEDYVGVLVGMGGTAGI